MAVDAAGTLAEKVKKLKSIIRGYGRAAVAFSGGADSTLLAVVCHEVLGEGFLAVTAASPIHCPDDLKNAKASARRTGFEHLVIETGELRNKSFVANPADRCYHCKRHIFSNIRKAVRKRGIGTILDGTNADDLKTMRPGHRAAKKMGVRSPLAEAGLTKAEIRVLLRRRGLPNWARPAEACLATRVPYGTMITEAILERVRKAEKSLARMGFKSFRVRHHGDVARIELQPEDLERAVERRRLIAERIRAAGYRFATLDLAGYQMGCFDA
jgi:uncharacterized protein